MNKRLLIVFSGIDGSGKSTQVNLLIGNLKKDGIDASLIYLRWDQLLLRAVKDLWKKSIAKKAPGSGGDFDSYKKNERRNLLSNPVFRWLWIKYFFIDYGLQLLVKLRIQLFGKRLIISDRMLFDSLIDQAVDLGEKKHLLFDSMDSFWVKIIFPEPDLVIYVDCPEEVAFARKDDIPDIDYLLERRKLYLELADKYGWFKVDGTLPVDEISGRIKDKVYKELGV